MSAPRSALHDQYRPSSTLSTACRRSTMDGSTDTKGSGASTAASGPDIVSDENGAWGESLKASWKPFSLNPWRLFLDCRAARIVTVEPVVFLYMYGTYLFLFATQQYFFWRYGKEALTNTSFPDLNRTAFCISTDDLDTYGTNDTSNDVQTSANNLLSYSNLPSLLISIVVAMIFGPLSDTLGRKFIFFSVGTGVVVQGVLAFVVIWFEWDMYFFILSSTVPGFFGGYASMLAASFAYAADISTPGKCRSIRIAVIEAMIYASGAVSQGGAGGMLQRLNCTFWPLILMYMASGVLILVYTAVFLPEPLSRLERLQKVADRPKGVKSLLNGLKMFLCPSEYSTWKLWAALIVLCIMVSNFVGSQEITAFFLEGHPLKWGPAVIGIYDVVAMVTHGVATIAVLSLLVALSLPDVVIALIGVVFSGGMNLFTGFVKNTREMFLGEQRILQVTFIVQRVHLPTFQ